MGQWWQVAPVGGEGCGLCGKPHRLVSVSGPGLCKAPQGGILSGTASPGYTPACGAEAGGRSPVQCSPAQESCWCVLGSGEEVPGTRVVGSQPACESKMCPQGPGWGMGGGPAPLFLHPGGGGLEKGIVGEGREGLRTWWPGESRERGPGQRAPRGLSVGVRPALPQLLGRWRGPDWMCEWRPSVEALGRAPGEEASLAVQGKDGGGQQACREGEEA